MPQPRPSDGDYRSRSFNDGMMQLEVYGGRSAPGHDFRSYSTSYAYSYNGGGGYGPPKEVKGKPDLGPSSSSRGGWVFSDPEFQRKRRVASYKAYAVEGKVKGSLRRSFRWLKDKYTRVVYGWWYGARSRAPPRLRVIMWNIASATSIL